MLMFEGLLLLQALKRGDKEAGEALGQMLEWVMKVEEVLAWSCCEGER